MTEQNRRITARIGYEPHFSWRYLLPQYWGIWLGILGLLLLAYMPHRWRDYLAAKLGKIISKKAKKQRHRAKVNLTYCFPQWSEEKKERIILKSLIFSPRLIYYIIFRGIIRTIQAP